MRISKKEPNESLSGLTLSFQHEWDQYKRVSDHLAETFEPLDCAINGTFTPDMFRMKQTQYEHLQITPLPVNISVIGILQPTQEAPLNLTTSRVITYQLVASILGGVEFETLSHNSTMDLGQTYVRVHKADTYGA